MFTNEINNSSWEAKDSASFTSSCQDDREPWLWSKPIASACRAMGYWSGHWLHLGTMLQGAWELLTPWLYFESQDFQVL